MWQPSTRITPLESGRIDVWRVPLDDESLAWSNVLAHLSADEERRAASFRFPADERRFARTRGVLRDLLGHYCVLPPAEIEFAYSPKGKPHLAGAPAASNLQFNVSHCGDLALIAVAANRQVGVDVERIRPGVAGSEIARRYFSTSEVDNLLSLPEQQREAAFFRCWTRKEALVKAIGEGVSFGLSSFSVSLLAEEGNALRSPPPRTTSSWQVSDLPLDEGYFAALAFAQPESARWSLWTWP